MKYQSGFVMLRMREPVCVDDKTTRMCYRCKHPTFLGSGACSHVYHMPDPERKTGTAENWTVCEESLVVKDLFIKYLAVKDNVDLEKKLHALSIARELEHPNIVKCFAMEDPSLFDIDNLRSRPAYSIIQEYCEGGNLKELLHGGSRYSHLAELYALHLLQALHYLHTYQHENGTGILHGDISPENIFFSKDRKVVKIGDLDTCTFLATDGYHPVLPIVGKETYRAPEVHKHFFGDPQQNTCAVGLKADIWSMGYVLAELFSPKAIQLKQPFGAIKLPLLSTTSETLATIQDGRYGGIFAPDYSGPYQSILNQCFRRNPNDRPSTQILLDAFQNVIIQKELKRC